MKNKLETVIDMLGNLPLNELVDRWNEIDISPVGRIDRCDNIRGDYCYENNRGKIKYFSKIEDSPIGLVSMGAYAIWCNDDFGFDEIREALDEPEQDDMER